MKNSIVSIMTCFFVLVVLLPLMGQQYNPKRDTVLQKEDGTYEFLSISYDADRKGELTYRRDIDSAYVRKLFYDRMRKRADLYAGIMLKKRELEIQMQNFETISAEVLQPVMGKEYKQIISDSLRNEFDGVWLMSVSEGGRTVNYFLHVKNLHVQKLKTNNEGYLEPAKLDGQITCLSPYWIEIKFNNFAEETFILFGSDVFFSNEGDTVFLKKTNREYENQSSTSSN